MTDTDHPRQAVNERAICSAEALARVSERISRRLRARAGSTRTRRAPRVVRTFNQALRAGVNYFINSGLVVTQNRVFFGGSRHAITIFRRVRPIRLPAGLMKPGGCGWPPPNRQSQI